MKPKKPQPKVAANSLTPPTEATPTVASVLFTPAAFQASLPVACRLCQDTGRVIGKFCWCPAGTAARLRSRESGS